MSSASTKLITAEEFFRMPDPDVAADLCVEVRSPGQSRPELAEKAAEYLRAGVRLVWGVDPRDCCVTIHLPDTEPTHLTEDATLDGADVLPVFTCRVAELFS